MKFSVVDRYMSCEQTYVSNWVHYGSELER